MNESTVKTLADNWLVVAAVIALLVSLGAIIGGVLVSAFKFADKWERRIEAIVERVVEAMLSSKAFGEAVQRISEAFTAEVKTQIADLRTRDSERAEAMKRAHQKIDDLAKETASQIIDLHKRLGERA